jgi:signal transduction histidine kinase
VMGLVGHLRENDPGERIHLTIETERLPIHVDVLQVRRAILHVIDNALRYSPAGTPVTIRVHSEGTDAIVEVQDQGIGLDRSDLLRIFEPFVHGAGYRTRGSPGAGLGLYLTKGIIEGHGGRVEAESEGPGQGSVFRLGVPMRTMA